MGEKRKIWPRLWLLSTDEVVEVLAYSRKPLQLKSFLPKLFVGVHDADMSVDGDLLVV